MQIISLADTLISFNIPAGTGIDQEITISVSGRLAYAQYKYQG